ncbi:MAG: hypothetical protein QOC78_302 [Solirubrobacteraceae bacterium]|jgi:hypothetical protein|nr:hypothetical protein [Solirubrobacteraceae bacterium]
MRFALLSAAVIALVVLCSDPATVHGARAAHHNRASGAQVGTSAHISATSPPDTTPPPRPPASDPEPPAGVNQGDAVSVGDGAAVADPLVANGLGGALCRNAQLHATLSPAAQRNCQTAGTVAASAPIDHWGFDVHIDTGALGVSPRMLQSALQTLVLTPLWTLLVWLTHAVLTLLEWAFAIDLLDAATMGSIARGLTAMRDTITEPWLLCVLALAAIALLYDAVVRRRIGDSLAAVAAMAAMILAGLWIITDPAGTVGEVSRTVNRAGLATVAAVSAQDPGRGAAALGDGLREVFATAVVGPWCYLEFGDVDWCRNPRRLDPDLVDAARRLRRQLRSGPRCHRPAVTCLTDDASREAQLLGSARSNGELFLAFPANGGERNSITNHDSLYRALCANDDDNHCQGPGAQAAQWRTEAGTWPRAGGLVLITVGTAGMLALLVFIALRLLGAAILTVVYLLLAPIAVLAPALGESGRATFQAWGVRLLGALIAKLVYAVLLGVVLVTLSILDGLGSVGWWTQWLLVAATWWIIFVKRDEVLAYARLGHGDTGRRGARLVGDALAARQLARVAGTIASPARQVSLRAGRTTVGAAQATRARLRQERTLAAEQRSRTAAQTVVATRRGQAQRTLDADHRAAAGRMARAPTIEAHLSAVTARRRRIATEIAAAHTAGDHRRVARLMDRDARLRRFADTQRASLSAADELTRRGASQRHATGSPHSEGDHRDRAELLDREAAKRPGVAPGPRADANSYRDYPRLAALADLSREDYLGLGAAEQRHARSIIDRELAARGPATDPRAADPTADWWRHDEGLSAEVTRPARQAPESPADRRRRQLSANEDDQWR